MVAALVATAGLWTWLGQKWVEERFGVRLEKFKAEQQKELERLRHRLSSRISKIHDKEFEVLPKAWLMLNDLHGTVAIALGLTFKTYPDFRRLSDAKFEEFLTISPASRLSESQKEALRKASDRQQFFSEAMAGIDFDDAREKHRLFHNYLIEHRIFMTDELREKFGAVDDSLSTALTSYDAKDWELKQSGMKKVMGMKDMIDEVEQAVQQRLHYEEA